MNKVAFDRTGFSLLPMVDDSRRQQIQQVRTVVLSNTFGSSMIEESPSGPTSRNHFCTSPSGPFHFRPALVAAGVHHRDEPCCTSPISASTWLHSRQIRPPSPRACHEACSGPSTEHSVVQRKEQIHLWTTTRVISTAKKLH